MRVKIDVDSSNVDFFDLVEELLDRGIKVRGVEPALDGVSNGILSVTLTTDEDDELWAWLRQQEYDQDSVEVVS